MLSLARAQTPFTPDANQSQCQRRLMGIMGSICRCTPPASMRTRTSQRLPRLSRTISLKLRLRRTTRCLLPPKLRAALSRRLLLVRRDARKRGVRRGLGSSEKGPAQERDVMKTGSDKIPCQRAFPSSVRCTDAKRGWRFLRRAAPRTTLTPAA